MIQINGKYGYPVKYVKTGTAKTGLPFTSFSIADKVKNGAAWKYYTVTIWGEELDLHDGDKVILTEITNIGSYFYNGKTVDTISARAKVLDDSPNFEDEEAPMIRYSDDKTIVSPDDPSLPWNL